MTLNVNIKYLVIAVLVLILSGCSSHQARSTSSIYDFLYSGKEKVISPSIPNLRIPLNIGIAFIPENKTESRSVNAWSGKTLPGINGLPQKLKTELLEGVISNFTDLDYVENITVIPSTYLTPQGGFTNLDQISAIHDVDLMALVSYDQIQFTDSNFLSLSYWTLIGAYIISGEKNDTSTMLDTVIYDIKSRKLLFRAPGISSVKGRSTPININEELRKDSIKGFRLAVEDMKNNLAIELQKFERKLKKRPDTLILSRKDGYVSGAGSVNLLWAMIIFSMVLISKICNRKQ